MNNEQRELLRVDHDCGTQLGDGCEYCGDVMEGKIRLCELCGDCEAVMAIVRHLGSKVLPMKRGEHVCEVCAWLCQDCGRQSVEEIGDTLCIDCARALK